MPGEMYIEDIKQQTPVDLTSVNAKLDILLGAESLHWELAVKDERAVPPASPSVGARYLVIGTASGAWAGHEGDIAEWNGSSWEFTTPVRRTAIYIENIAKQKRYNGTTWLVLGVTTTNLEAKLDMLLGGEAAPFEPVPPPEPPPDAPDNLTLSGIRKSLADIASNQRHDYHVPGTATANWNGGTATSGETGGDVVTVSVTGQDILRIQSLLVDISNLVGTAVKVKLFYEINGNERRSYQQSFDATSDPPGLWIVDGTVGVYKYLRVEIESDAAADDGKSVGYDYIVTVPGMAAVETQLASCWDVISGCGIYHGTKSSHEAAWVLRSGEWLVYDSYWGLDHIGTIQTGDEVWLYATEACHLVYDGHDEDLSVGWNSFTW